jgi:hypothetical protein
MNDVVIIYNKKSRKKKDLHYITIRIKLIVNSVIHMFFFYLIGHVQTEVECQMCN